MSFFPSINLKDLPGASNFLPFGGSSSLNTTKNTSTIPSINNQTHGERYGNALQYRSIIDFGADKHSSLDDDILPAGDLGTSSLGTSLDHDSISVALHPDVRRIIEEEDGSGEGGVVTCSPANSPMINRRRDRRALKKFRETSRHSRPLRGPGTTMGWSDLGE